MTRPSWLTVSRTVRLALGAALIVHEGIVRPAAQLDVLMTGLGLLGIPDVVRFDRWLSSHEPSSPSNGDRPAERTP